MENCGRNGSGQILRIAQIAPLYESVPPRFYGGTERVVSYITEELVRRGHEVTLFASGDSETAAKLESGCSQALRLAGKTDIGNGLQLAMAARAFDQSLGGQFDIIHSHIDYWAFPLSRLTRQPTVTTLHWRLDLPMLRPMYEQFPETALISISNAQRAPFPRLNWLATVYHGLPRDLLQFSPGPGKYLAFLGRISPEKRLDIAIEAATRAAVPFRIAAKVDPADREYFEAVIKPLIKGPLVEYVGEIAEHEKNDFLGNAIALLFTIDWPEPFGLAVIEALACGTPVIARPCGAVPEIIRPGVTGILASDVDGLVDAVSQVGSISRENCRNEFEQRFTAEIMVNHYEQAYQRLLLHDQVRARARMPPQVGDLTR